MRPGHPGAHPIRGHRVRSQRPTSGSAAFVADRAVFRPAPVAAPPSRGRRSLLISDVRRRCAATDSAVDRHRLQAGRAIVRAACIGIDHHRICPGGHRRNGRQAGNSQDTHETHRFPQKLQAGSWFCAGECGETSAKSSPATFRKRSVSKSHIPPEAAQTLSIKVIWGAERALPGPGHTPATVHSKFGARFFRPPTNCEYHDVICAACLPRAAGSTGYGSADLALDDVS